MESPVARNRNAKNHLRAISVETKVVRARFRNSTLNNLENTLHVTEEVRSNAVR